ncbi:biotin transport system substrate-specific component [Sporomusaceae bacterium BoRhaA]|uniref:biotin transporter BioY n=1 Tax=Pelorhabdus rhamnosifermentans TaxID=2772457 RepID=UPI0028AFDC54|nr:biotin transporter BioY [Pelorhabdus rhamnosifermentans]MBU2700507.1 biotin transport system substrate-specific component [Pelorhabdus rhamnosifermentans]
MIQQNKYANLTYPAFFAALTVIMSFISIPLPFNPVPITGQTLAVMLTGSILSVRQAGWSILTYLLIGAVGLPVFSGFSGGIGVLLGPTGGYLLAYFPGVMLIALLKGKNNKIWPLALANIIGGIGVVYLVGVTWLSVFTGMGIQKAMMVGALPFIPGDIIKLGMATVLGREINKRLFRGIYPAKGGQ